VTDVADVTPNPEPPPPPPGVIPLAAPVLPGPQAAVLDYASPRRQPGKTRLPARSILAFESGADGRQFTVTESLAGKRSAVAAIVFAVIVLLVLGAASANFMRSSLRPDRSSGVFLLTVWAGYALLLLAVVNNTWRRTILRAGAAAAGGEGTGPPSLTLTFTAPFYRRHYRWAAAQIGDVRVVRTSGPLPHVPLAELQIRTTEGRLVRLFTDHDERQIEWAHAGVRHGIGAEDDKVPG
jgi:hypothetical protein